MSKRNLFVSFAAIVLCFLASSCVKEKGFEDRVKEVVQLDSLNARISSIESQLKQINGNIASLQTIVEALQKNVYVTKVETLKEGYKLIFSDGTSVTITNGQDGEDGRDAPVIGVKKDADDIYYWTLTYDGQTDWLLDDSGNKMRVTGEKGDKGETGEPGKQGEPGEQGQPGAAGPKGEDGVSPIMGIDEEGYWRYKYGDGEWIYIYDAGGNKIQSQGAKGDKGDGGDKGDKGDKGDDGDSMFSGIDTSKEGYVILTLADGTTKIELPYKSELDKLVARIQKIDAVPDYNDGSVELMEADSNVLSFAVRPYAAIKELVDLDSTELFKVVVTETYTKADADIDTLEIQHLWLDEGILKIQVNTASINDAEKKFYKMTKSLSACMSIDDGNTSMTSGFFTLTPMVSYPEAPEQRCVNINGIWWAPVNCGYKGKGSEGQDTIYTYGQLYQWGRKHGTGYNDGNSWKEPLSTVAYGPIDEENEDSTKFYVDQNCPYDEALFGGKYFDWMNVANHFRWNSAGLFEDDVVKTPYDPCPEGWRVPTAKELSSLVGGGIGGIEINYNQLVSLELDTIYNYKQGFWPSEHNGQGGYWLDGTNSPVGNKGLFLPMAGLRVFNEDGGCGFRYSEELFWNLGGYWSSSPNFLVPDNKSGQSMALMCWSFIYAGGGFANVNTKYGSRAYALSVRCVKYFPSATEQAGKIVAK